MNNLTSSYAWPVFVSLMYLHHLMSVHLGWSDNLITPEFPYRIGGIGIIFVLYVVITLFRAPMESAQYLFEHTLPFTRTTIFMAKYLGGYLHLFLTFAIFYGILFPLTYGYFDLYHFSVLLASLSLSLVYLYSMVVLFALVTRRNVGAIIGGLLLMVMQPVVLYLNINFPPNPPVWTGYLYAVPIGLVSLAIAYMFYRGVDL